MTLTATLEFVPVKASHAAARPKCWVSSVGDYICPDGALPGRPTPPATTPRPTYQTKPKPDPNGYPVPVRSICELAPEYCKTPTFPPGPPLPPLDCAEKPGPFTCAPFSRDIFYNPFNKDSMYHLPLACGLRYAGDTDPTTIAWKANGFGNFKIGCTDLPTSTRAFCDENAHPIFIAPPGTPTETVAKFGPGNGLPVTVRMPREAKIRLDRGGGKDATTSIYYPDSHQVHVFYGYSYEPGGASAERYLTYSGSGTGHPNRVGDPDVGTPASGVGNWLGILRGHEVNATGWDYNHRFKIAVVRKDNQGPAHILGRGFHLPANGTDGGITGDQNLGPFNYGDIVALPHNIDINALRHPDGSPLSEPGKRFARAMQQYGVILADGGPNGIRGDQALDRVKRDMVRKDFQLIWDMMRRVEDFTTNAAYPAAVAAGKIGPGDPLGPNCAFDAPPPPP